jgi:hypothetical protein
MSKQKSDKENEEVEVEVAVGELESTPVKVKRSLKVKDFLIQNKKSTSLKALFETKTEFSNLARPILIPDVSGEVSIGDWYDRAQKENTKPIHISPPKVLYTFKKADDNDEVMNQHNFARFVKSIKELKESNIELKQSNISLNKRVKIMEKTFYANKSRTLLEYYRILLTTRYNQQYKDSVASDGKLSWNNFLGKIKNKLANYELLCMNGNDSKYSYFSNDIHTCTIDDLETLADCDHFSVQKEDWSIIINQVLENKDLIENTYKSLRSRNEI